MKTVFCNPKLCTPLCIFLVSWLGGGGGGGMYDPECGPDRKVIPKKTQIGPLTVMYCTRLVNSVIDHYRWISTVYIMIFKSKQFQYWQIHMYVHNLLLKTATKIQKIIVDYKSIVSVLIYRTIEQKLMMTFSRNFIKIQYILSVKCQ